MIAVIDYEMGNLGSVAKALNYLGLPALVTQDADTAFRADKLVLPGVGAMEYAMQQLKRLGLDQAIREYLKTGRPFLGICLGMQLLFERSEEGGAAGLGILAGQVKRFPRMPGLKIPHMGWNSLNGCRLDLLPEGGSFYFVHSYYAEPADTRIIAAQTRHGIDFCAAASWQNALLTQFHPEKSGATGLALLKSWASQHS
jgi:imidazole glycerol-phosphate synthase subunit HisH